MGHTEANTYQALKRLIEPETHGGGGAGIYVTAGFNIAADHPTNQEQVLHLAPGGQGAFFKVEMPASQTIDILKMLREGFLEITAEEYNVDPYKGRRVVFANKDAPSLDAA